MQKIAISFFSILLAWFFTRLLHNVYQVHFTPWHRVNDAEFWIFWPLIFSFLGWLIFFVPLLFIKRLEVLLAHRLYFPLFGLVYGCVAFTFLIGWLFLFVELSGAGGAASSLIQLYGQAGLIGLMTGLFYSQMVHILRRG